MYILVHVYSLAKNSHIFPSIIMNCTIPYTCRIIIRLTILSENYGWLERLEQKYHCRMYTHTHIVTVLYHSHCKASSWVWESPSEALTISTWPEAKSTNHVHVHVHVVIDTLRIPHTCMYSIICTCTCTIHGYIIHVHVYGNTVYMYMYYVKVVMHNYTLYMYMYTTFYCTVG